MGTVSRATAVVLAPTMLTKAAAMTSCAFREVLGCLRMFVLVAGLAEDDDRGADPNAVIEVNNISIGHADAA